MSTHALDRLPPRRLLARLLDAPDLPGTIQRLEPGVLHTLVEVCGLEACTEIVAHATPAQLMRVFDLDLWHSAKPGQDERFDADRFVLWLELLADTSVALAAEKLAALDFDLVSAAVTRHFLVLDQTWTMMRWHPLADSRSHEIGAYTLYARSGEPSDAFIAILTELESDRGAFFAKLLARCCAISTDHVDDNDRLYHVASAEERVLSDVAAEREQRREEQGFVTPSQAATFLEISRRLRLGGPSIPSRDAVTAGYFRTIARHPGSGAGFRRESEPAPAGHPHGQNIRALPAAGENGRLSSIVAQLQYLGEHDESAYFSRLEELGYLANALVAGGSFNSRSFTGGEAYDAVVALTNLGLESWPGQWPTAGTERPQDGAVPEDFLTKTDLVTVFQVGLTTLHQQVGLYALEKLDHALQGLSRYDGDLRSDIVELRRKLEECHDAGTPWRVRDHLDVVAILDTQAWATLLGLVDQCPVVPKDAGRETPGRRHLRVSIDVEFVSGKRQVDWARHFLESLPQQLG
jgi:hypothetical protein